MKMYVKTILRFQKVVKSEISCRIMRVAREQELRLSVFLLQILVFRDGATTRDEFFFRREIF